MEYPARMLRSPFSRRLRRRVRHLARRYTGALIAVLIAIPTAAVLGFAIAYWSQ